MISINSILNFVKVHKDQILAETANIVNYDDAIHG